MRRDEPITLGDYAAFDNDEFTRLMKDGKLVCKPTEIAFIADYQVPSEVRELLPEKPDVPKETRYIYRLSVGDVESTYDVLAGDGAWEQLDDSKRDEYIDAAQECVENYFGEHWTEVIQIGIEQVATAEEIESW